MLPLRHFLLVAVLFFAQLAAGAHAVEHAAGHDEGLPTHVCELCLAAHSLGAALPSLASLPPAPPARFFLVALADHGRTTFPSPIAAQRGPPHS